MKIESPEFTRKNLEEFLGETLEHERLRLADRLEADSALDQLETALRSG